MLEAKPKIEGAKKFRMPARATAPLKEFSAKVLGLESHTFEIRNTKYAPKYNKTVDDIVNHIQKEYKVRAATAKAIKALSHPTLHIPGYPTAKNGATAVSPGDVLIWQQDVDTAEKQIVQLMEKGKHAYTFVVGKCSSDLMSKLKGSNPFVKANNEQDIIQLLLII